FGRDGACLATLPAPPVDVVDTTGAGDAFLAAFIATYLAYRPLEACLAQGITAGSTATTFFGAQPPGSGPIRHIPVEPYLGQKYLRRSGARADQGRTGGRTIAASAAAPARPPGTGRPAAEAAAGALAAHPDRPSVSAGRPLQLSADPRRLDVASGPAP